MTRRTTTRTDGQRVDRETYLAIRKDWEEQRRAALARARDLELSIASLDETWAALEAAGGVAPADAAV